jgi:hypothetical protein
LKKESGGLAFEARRLLIQTVIKSTTPSLRFSLMDIMAATTATIAPATIIPSPVIAASIIPAAIVAMPSSPANHPSSPLATPSLERRRQWTTGDRNGCFIRACCPAHLGGNSDTGERSGEQ